MGDRTQLTITCSYKDVDFWTEIFDTPQVEDKDGQAVELTFDEVNYAGTDELIRAAKQGKVFVASWDSGYEYPSGRMACDGRLYCEVETTSYFGNPVVEVPRPGDNYLSQEDKDKPYLFWAIFDRAYKYIDNVDDWIVGDETV